MEQRTEALKDLGDKSEKFKAGTEEFYRNASKLSERVGKSWF